MTKSTTDLAAYLAIHHHQNNMAMMFTNPDKKVRLLLSYVLYKSRLDLERIARATYYRTNISQYHLEYQETARKYEAGELSGEMAVRMAELLNKKAEIAHKCLMELSNATN